MSTATTSIDKEARKLSKVKIDIMREPRFVLWQNFMMLGKTSIEDDVPTAATNGRDEFYGREFVKRLSHQELAFVVLHEALHKAYRHLTVWRKLYKENKTLANMACDYVINLELKDMDPRELLIAMPKDEAGKPMALIDEAYRGMNTKQVYELLKQKHGKDYGKTKIISIGEGGFDVHDWDGAEDLTDEEKEALQKEVDAAIRQGQIAHEKLNGQGAGGLPRELKDLITPQVDWREQLREFVKSICSGRDNSSWRKPNRRFIGNDIYMPTLVSERVGRIALGIDMSGSIDEELKAFFSEIVVIGEEVQPESIDILYWDGEVGGHEVYEGDYSSILNTTKPVGGGGTAPSCVSKYIKDKELVYELVIMFTDGHVGNDWGGDWQSPVLWVVVNNEGASSSTGKTIHLKGD